MPSCDIFPAETGMNQTEFEVADTLTRAYHSVAGKVTMGTVVALLSSAEC